MGALPLRWKPVYLAEFAAPTKEKRMYLVFALICGIAVAFMVQLNGMLEAEVGSIVSLVTIHSAGLVGSLVYWAIHRNRDREKGHRGKPAPIWFLSAGLLGIPVVFLNMYLFAQAGILLALSGTLAGQSLAAMLLESSSWNQSGSSANIQHLMVLLLILPGTVLIGIFSGAGPLLIGLSLLPGGILLVQTMFNSYNAKRWGHPQMLCMNYSTALLVLVPLFFMQGSYGKITGLHLIGINPIILIGGGVLGVIAVGATALLLQKISPVKLFFGLYTGQLGSGIVLDAINGKGISAVKLIGVLCIAIGLLAGEWQTQKEAIRQ